MRNLIKSVSDVDVYMGRRFDRFSRLFDRASRHTRRSNTRASYPFPNETSSLDRRKHVCPVASSLWWRIACVITREAEHMVFMVANHGCDTSLSPAILYLECIIRGLVERIEFEKEIVRQDTKFIQKKIISLINVILQLDSYRLT